MPETNEQLARMFANRLKKNVRRVGDWARRNKVSCYRIYDGDIPEIPLVVDTYEGRIQIGLFAKSNMPEELAKDWLDTLIGVIVDVLKIEQKNLFLKTRQRQRGLSQYERMSEEGTSFEVSEGGLKFHVNMTDFLDTGLFLDHRMTRDMVRKEAKDKRFLNLFAYTGSFSVYAADGGAKSTTTIDMSNTYLGWAEHNMALNGFTGPEHSFVRADLLAYLRDAHKVKERYDLVVLDPPTFSNSKKMDDVFDIRRDHVWLINQTLSLVNPGGVVYFSTNYRGFQFNPQTLELGKVQASSIEEITAQTQANDFAYSRPHLCWRIGRRS